jgi:DMSO/TMAO reductase YedYZ molybdopterin-dependent catalytic subunit
MHRRSVLASGLAWGGVAFLGRAGLLAEQIAATTCSDRPLGELLGLVPLHGDRARQTPFGEIVGGSGLDARLFTDLSTLETDRLITPTPNVFVRTAAWPGLDPSSWSIAMQGAAAIPSSLSLAALERDARPMGAHLLECSGNADPDNFGLMSVAEWDGVPLTQLLGTHKSAADATAVLIAGRDDESQASRTSTPGASWIFPLDALDRLGAFLAVRLNGEPLTRDHGAPVRLVVPGWYACSWIKWVNEIRLVSADAATTSQMLEFSLRTHQSGVPKLAKDYEPPAIDLAAVPIRVEKRRVGGAIEYRVIGIVWGGDRPVDRLMIRFSAGETPVAFPICPAPRTHKTWSLWEYRWRPGSPGVYTIALTAADPSIRTRRLDVSYYARRVVVD